MKICITGILGFLGSHLAERLNELGHDVWGNDNMLCSSAFSYLKNIGDFGRDRIHIKDCRDYKLMRSIVTDVYSGPADVLIHCAATAHEGLSNFSPSFITQNIYEASVATFSAAIANGVKRIIFMSSMARYGSAHKLPFEEYYWPLPIDPYGIAKVAAERTLISLCELHNVEYVIAVPHNIIGQRQKYNDPYRNVASIMINRALQGKPLIVYGDGSQKRCFSPIDDCLDSLVKMIDAPISGEVINIGPDGGEISVLELANMINDLTGNTAGIEFVKGRPNEVKNAWCSSDKARKLLGYEAKKPLKDCLAEMVLYIKEQNRIIGPQEFQYNFPLEISEGCPATWKDKLI